MRKSVRMRGSDPGRIRQPGTYLAMAVLTIIAVTAPAAPKDPATTRVSSRIVGRPLSELLRSLGKQAGCGVRAERDIDPQRVSVRFRERSLLDVLEWLACLLSHNPDGSQGYRWYRERRGDTDPVTLVLRRSHSSRLQEQKELEYPLRRTAELLRQLRSLARTPRGRRAEFRTDLPAGWKRPDSELHLRAAALLTDAQLDALVRGVTIPLDPSVFPDEGRLFDERRRAAGESRERFAPALRIRWKNRFGDRPSQPGTFFLELMQAAHSHPGWNVYYLRWQNDYTSLPDREVDLGPLLRAPGVPREQYGDPAHTIVALADAADLTVFQEHFYQSAVPHGGLSDGIPVMKGPLREVIRSICDTWGYCFRRQGDLYYFWPGNWALARYADIAEPEIEHWRDTLRRQGTFMLEDRIRLAARYSQPQLSQTMRVALRQAGRWNRQVTVALRILGSVSPQVRTRMEGEPGVPLEELARHEVGALLREWLTPEDEVEPLPMEGGRLLFTHLPRGGVGGEPYLVAWRGEQPFFLTRLSLRQGTPPAEHGVQFSDID